MVHIHENIHSRLAHKTFAPHRIFGFGCDSLTLSFTSPVASAFWDSRRASLASLLERLFPGRLEDGDRDFVHKYLSLKGV